MPEVNMLDVTRFGEMRLDDILDLGEPERTRAIRAWIAAGDLMDGDEASVLVKTSDGKPLPTEYRNKHGRQVVVDHNGRRVSRRRALDMLLKYGKSPTGKWQGQYLGRDQRTGFTKASFINYIRRNPELEDVYGEPSFITNYLTHVPDEPVPAGAVVLSGAADDEE